VTSQSKPALSLRRRQFIEEKTGLSCSAIYSRMDPKSPHFDPDFPRPIKLGKGKNPPVAWIEAEVDAWIEAKITNSRKTVESPSSKNLAS
jgi:prophage regulatory protein